MPKRRETFEVLPNQADFIETEALFSAAYGGVGCQPAGSPCLMADGSWRAVEAVSVGDKVLSPQEDGSYIVATVTATFVYPDSLVYEVKTTSRRAPQQLSYRCSANHVLPIVGSRRWWEYPVGASRLSRSECVPLELTVANYLSRSDRFKREARLRLAPAYPLPVQELPVHPYVLGVLLGDGCFRGAVYTLTNHLDDAAIVRKCERLGVAFKGPTFSRDNGVGCYRLHVELRREIDRLGLAKATSHTKRVPAQYMVASLEQRLELLAGLIDTDGSAREFSSTSVGLAADFVALVRSVGGYAVSVQRETRAVVGGQPFTSFRVTFSFNGPTAPVTLARKAAPVRRPHRTSSTGQPYDKMRHSFSVAPVGLETVYGFTLDSPSQWYVTDDHIVTHNSGKTYAAQWRMFRRLRKYPRAGHYVVGADFEQLRGGYFLDIRNLLEDVLHWQEGRDFKYKDSPRPTIILTDTGARIRALSAELAERIRSTQIQSLHAEEPQTWHNGEQVWRTLVGRMRHSLRSAQAYPDMPIAAWLTFNPGGVPGAPVGSWLYKLVEEQWRAAGYPSWRFSLRDNYLLLNQAQYVANLEANLPPHLWPVEIDGQWPTSGGDVYRNFDQTIHSTVPLGLPPMGLREVPLLWTFDFNVGFMCSTIAQTFVQQPIVEYKEGQLKLDSRLPVAGWQRRTFYFIDEIAMPNAGATDVVQRFISMEDGKYAKHARQHGLTLYGDCSGGARSQVISATSAIRSNWDAIVSGLRAVGIHPTIRIQSRNPNPMERVNMMNEQFGSGSGYGVLVDSMRCPVLINDWVNVRFKPGTNEIEQKAGTEAAARLTHMSDAAGYMVWVERKLEKDGPRSIKWSMVR